jgi:predicted N-acetyltransferase YhbS
MGKLTGPSALAASHDRTLFSSGEEVLDSWIQIHAETAVAVNSAKVFVVCDGDRIVGYSALATSSILVRELPKSQRSGLPRHPVPALLLGRLAVDLEYRNQGIAKVLVRDAVEKALLIQPMAGLVALIAHSKNEDAKKFYLNLGFEASPATDNLMCLYLGTQ